MKQYIKRIINISLLLAVVFCGSMNVKAYDAKRYTKYTDSKTFCNEDFGLAKSGGKNYDDITTELEKINREFTGCSNSTMASNSGTCEDKRYTSYKELYKSCPISEEENASLAEQCRVCINYNSASNPDKTYATLCSSATCASWVNNNCKNNNADTYEKCLSKCECNLETGIETCKTACYYEFIYVDPTEEYQNCKTNVEKELDKCLKDNNKTGQQCAEDKEKALNECEVKYNGGSNNTNGDRYENVQGCSVLGSLWKEIKNIYNITWIGLAVGLVLLSMYDFTKAVISEKEDARKKAFKNFEIRLIIIVIFLLLPSLITFVLKFFDPTIDSCMSNIK